MTRYEYAVARPASMPDMSGREMFTILCSPTTLEIAMFRAESAPRVNGQPPFVVRRDATGGWERLNKETND